MVCCVSCRVISLCSQVPASLGTEDGRLGLFGLWWCCGAMQACLTHHPSHSSSSGIQPGVVKLSGACGEHHWAHQDLQVHLISLPAWSSWSCNVLQRLCPVNEHPTAHSSTASGACALGLCVSLVGAIPSHAVRSCAASHSLFFSFQWWFSSPPPWMQCAWGVIAPHICCSQMGSYTNFGSVTCLIRQKTIKLNKNEYYIIINWYYYINVIFYNILLYLYYII